jgi:hypothetical protein
VQKYLKKLAIASALLLSCSPSSTSAAETDSSLSFLRDVATNSSKLLAPSAFGIPSAWTMGWRNGFVAGALATNPRSYSNGSSSELDGSAAIGFGLGNPLENVGLDTYVGIISVNPKASNGSWYGFGEDGNVSFKLGKTFFTESYDSISFAVGVNNIIAWNAAKNMNENYYGVATFGSALNVGNHIYPVSVSCGAGTKQDSNKSAGVFAGLGIGLNPIVDLSAGYNANRWVSGLNFSFSRLENPIIRHLVLQVGVDDLFNHNNNRRGVFIAAIPFSL